MAELTLLLFLFLKHDLVYDRTNGNNVDKCIFVLDLLSTTQLERQQLKNKRLMVHYNKHKSLVVSPPIIVTSN